MKIFLVSTFLLFSVLVFSQQDKKPKKVNLETWQDSSAFFNGPEPILVGFGYYSDSLERVYNKVFFKAPNEYVAINSAADYYLWFTKKYAHLFENTDAYSFFYLQKDSRKMIEFILSNYTGEKLPLTFKYRNQVYNSPINQLLRGNDYKEIRDQADGYRQFRQTVIERNNRTSKDVDRKN